MSVSSQNSRRSIVAMVMTSMAMIAVEMTIVSTAMPGIVSDLGGLDKYSWVFGAFLLAQTSATVIFGKLADLLGRRPAVLSALAIFLVGSLLCGFAKTMIQLIVYRLVQGAGAGAVQPVVVTIIADLFPGSERGRVQGYLASVWAVSALTGPLLGGLLVHAFSWSWIFWINVPVGIFAFAGFLALLKEDAPTERARLDLLGAVLSTSAIAALMLFLSELEPPNNSVTLGFTGAALIASVVLFFFVEKRAAEPVISFEMWRKRPIAVANLGSLFAAMALIALTSFLPMYMQVVLHRSPVQAGLALTMVMVGWPIGATIAARIIPKVGIRRIFVAGSIFMPIGACMFLVVDAFPSPILAACGSAIMGFGMGNLGIASLILVQEVVRVDQRGSATAANLFCRNIGSTLGAAFFGTVFNISLGSALDGHQSTISELRRALTFGSAPTTVDPAVSLSLQYAMHCTFQAMVLVCIAIATVSFWMPEIQLRRQRRAGPAGELG
ncbi:MDR family MFS transporter [Caballeronia calidae]|nr:MDR family MFS transporter [Caballeronia calidae]